MEEEGGRRGLTDTLIGKPNGGAAADDESGGRLTMVLGVGTIAAVCGSYTVGSAMGYSSPAESGIMNDLGISLVEYSAFGSILYLGGLLGALCCGKITDLIGRRGAMWVTDALSIVGWLSIAFSQKSFIAKAVMQNAWMLYTGRLFLGFSVGVNSYVVPVYIAELTPKNLRGALVSVHVLMSAFGGSITYIIGVVVDWRLLALLGVIPSLLQFLLLFFVTESPRWLAKMGRRNEVETTLQRLRGKDFDVYSEARDIEVYTEQLQQMQHENIVDLLQQKYARPLIVGVGAMVLQQLSGLSGYCLYLSSILEKAGASASAGAVAAAILMIAGGFLSLLLMDTFGRRPLLLVVSVTGLCLGNCLTGLSFLFQDYGLWSNGVPTLNFISSMVFLGFSSIGIGGIPWIIMSEIFPVNVKGAAGSIVTFVSLGGACLVSFTFNYLFESSSAGVFFAFSGICFVGIIFVTKMVPETKGRTLEEIQASMSSSV